MQILYELADRIWEDFLPLHVHRADFPADHFRDDLYQYVHDVLINEPYFARLLGPDGRGGRTARARAAHAYLREWVEPVTVSGQNLGIMNSHRLLEWLSRHLAGDPAWYNAALQRLPEPTDAAADPTFTRRTRRLRTLVATERQRLAAGGGYLPNSASKHWLSPPKDGKARSWGSIHLVVGDQAAPVPEELSLFDALLCLPGPLAPSFLGDADAKKCFNNLLLSVNRPYGDLVAIGISPAAFLDITNTKCRTIKELLLEAGVLKRDEPRKPRASGPGRGATVEEFLALGGTITRVAPADAQGTKAPTLEDFAQAWARLEERAKGPGNAPQRGLPGYQNGFDDFAASAEGQLLLHDPHVYLDEDVDGSDGPRPARQLAAPKRYEPGREDNVDDDDDDVAPAVSFDHAATPLTRRKLQAALFDLRDRGLITRCEERLLDHSLEHGTALHRVPPERLGDCLASTDPYRTISRDERWPVLLFFAPRRFHLVPLPGVTLSRGADSMTAAERHLRTRLGGGTLVTAEALAEDGELARLLAEHEPYRSLPAAERLPLFLWFFGRDIKPLIRPAQRKR